MPQPDPQAARRFAVETVASLRHAGYQALWAGGCVRDQLLGLIPRDYDVATDAKPEEVRRVFGHNRTLAIGQAFGVITVLGSKKTGQIEVATFRCDAGYSDGRHPDAVRFSTAREDALRRDFTINGLFYDPLEDRVIDYVGGRNDIERGILRAIGDPLERIAEDKLRMLRAVRMAATFHLTVDPGTLAAVQQNAEQIDAVSPERTTAELRRMLSHANRRRAAELLAETGLLTVILPEWQEVADAASIESHPRWLGTLDILERLGEPAFATAFATLVREPIRQLTFNAKKISELCRRLRFTNHERESVRFLLQHEELIRCAKSEPWPRLQKLLIHDRIRELLDYARAVAEVLDGDAAQIDFCEQQLARPEEQWNPPSLLTGNDLKEHGLKPGPLFKRLLDAVRDAQLEGRVQTREDALELIETLSKTESQDSDASSR